MRGVPLLLLVVAPGLVHDFVGRHLRADDTGAPPAAERRPHRWTEHIVDDHRRSTRTRTAAVRVWRGGAEHGVEVVTEGHAAAAAAHPARPAGITSRATTRCGGMEQILQRVQRPATDDTSADTCSVGASGACRRRGDKIFEACKPIDDRWGGGGRSVGSRAFLSPRHCGAYSRFVASFAFPPTASATCSSSSVNLRHGRGARRRGRCIFRRNWDGAWGQSGSPSAAGRAQEVTEKVILATAQG